MARRACQRLGRQPGACWALVAGLMLVAATPLAGPDAALRRDAGGVADQAPALRRDRRALLVLTGVFARPTGRYARVMSHPVLRHLGHISYGIFCLHLPVLHLVIEVGRLRALRRSRAARSGR